jgi:arginine decarboxylase
VFWKDRLRSLFNTGVLGLPERALGDRLFLAIMNRAAGVLRQEADLYEDILPEVEAALIDRYFCNFSVFQSLPDFWAVDQLFPIVPIHRLAEQPTRRGTLHDVTCDSDGKIDRFVGAGEGLPGLELHEVGPDESYILGVFLTGAYQEILGDLHNLFGDTNTVHLRLGVESDDPAYDVVGLAHGDTVGEVLAYVHFESTALIATFRKKVSRATGISRAEANGFIADYVAGLAGYTYLEGGLS